MNGGGQIGGGSAVGGMLTNNNNDLSIRKADSEKFGQLIGGPEDSDFAYSGPMRN